MKIMKLGAIVVLLTVTLIMLVPIVSAQKELVVKPIDLNKELEIKTIFDNAESMEQLSVENENNETYIEESVVPCQLIIKKMQAKKYSKDQITATLKLGGYSWVPGDGNQACGRGDKPEGAELDLWNTEIRGPDYHPFATWGVNSGDIGIPAAAVSDVPSGNRLAGCATYVVDTNTYHGINTKMKPGEMVIASQESGTRWRVITTHLGKQPSPFVDDWTEAGIARSLADQDRQLFVYDNDEYGIYEFEGIVDASSFHNIKIDVTKKFENFYDRNSVLKQGYLYKTYIDNKLVKVGHLLNRETQINHADEIDASAGYPFSVDMDPAVFKDDTLYYGNMGRIPWGPNVPTNFPEVPPTTPITESHVVESESWLWQTWIPVTHSTISANAGGGGSISPSGMVDVIYGYDQPFTITPEPGYAIYDVLINGNSVGDVGGYTFTQVIADQTISATFYQDYTTLPLCPAGTPFDSTKYPQNYYQSDPMVFTCNWDGNGKVYTSGNASSLTGIYADDGYSIIIQPSGATFDAPEHWAHKHPVVDLTSGMTTGSNTFTLIIKNWRGLSMSYGSINGIGTDQIPYIVEVDYYNINENPIASDKGSTISIPSFIIMTDKGLMVNDTLVKN